MEQVLECIDGCCTVNENVEERHIPLQACSLHETLHNNELKYTCASSVYSSPTPFSVLRDGNDLCQSFVQENFMPSFQSVAAIDTDVYVSDSCKSVICSSSDVLSNSLHFHVKDDFSSGENLTTVPKCEDQSVSNLGDLTSRDDNEQCDESNTTFLSCTKGMSAKVSATLALLASRIKALCKIITTGDDKNKIFPVALQSTSLGKKYRHHSPGPSSIRYCDLLIAEVCISCGQGVTKRVAKRCARLNAVNLLQKPYLHLEESSGSDNTLKLVCSQTPSVNKSYDVVTRIDITGTSRVLCLPVIDVINCNEQQIVDVEINRLVDCFKRIACTVRTVLHVLKTVRGNGKVIDIAVHRAKVPKYLQIVGGQQFCCSLFIDTVLVAFSEACTRTRVRDNVYAAAIEIFCKPYLRLEGSEDGSPIRLVGYEEPFDDVPSGLLPSAQNDTNGELNPEEAQFISEEKLPSCDSQNSVLPTHEDRSEGTLSNPSPAVLLSTADLPAILTRFHHLSDRVKALFSDTAMGNNAATIVALALKVMKLPCKLRVIKLSQGRVYHCDLHIVSVFVASGEGNRRVKASDQAYANAAKLLQKPYLRLAIGPERSTMLVGSDKPFVETPSAIEPQQTPEITQSSPTVIDPVIDQTAEITKDCSSSLVSCMQNSVVLDTDDNKKCLSAAEVFPLVEKQRQNVGSCEILGTASELPSTMSVLLDHEDQPYAGNKPDVPTQMLNDSANEHEVSEQRKTVVIARSHKDLSRLVNRFHSLAHISKDIYTMFKSAKSAEHMVQMAVRMSCMCLKTDIVKLPDSRFRCQLSIDDIVVAVAEDYNKKDARKMAYSIAAERFCMPYLCLEEKHDAVQLLGSEEPFVESDNVKVNSRSRGFWLDSSIDAASGEDKKDLHETMPYTTDLSKLVSRFHGLACRVKTICNAKTMPINGGYVIIKKALGECNMQMSNSVVRVPGDGHHSELFIDGVLVACGKVHKKKKARCAAYIAAVELLRKPYLRLQENADYNWSFKLIGSDQPFVEVSLGDLPYDEKCVATDKGQCVKIEKESLGSGDATHSDKLHSADGTDVSGKVRTEMCFKNSSNLSLANGAAQADEGGLCKRLMSVSTHSTHISELVNEFSALARRVKCISGSSPKVHSDTDIVEMALADTQMQKRRLLIWMNSVSLLCELCVDGISVSYGEGDTKEQAKQAAYSAAVELLCKPYIQLQEYPGFSHRYSLVGSDEKFAAVSSSSVFPYRQYFVVADKRHEREKQTARYQSAMLDKNLVSHHGWNESLLQQHFQTFPARSLTDFVIIYNSHIEKERCIDILQQSANLNKWPLSYDLSRVEGGCRCRLTLGGHALGDAVMPTKKPARKAAAEQALNWLTSICYTVKIKNKKSDFYSNSLTRREILEAGTDTCRIPPDNIGYKLLTKMGWTGGALGKNNQGTVAQLACPTGFNDRCGLGFDRPVPFLLAIKRIIAEYVQSGGADNLVFSPELTSQERGIIFAEANKNHLQSHSHGERSYIVVNKESPVKRTPTELVNYLIEIAGEDNNYLLLGPSKVQL